MHGGEGGQADWVSAGDGGSTSKRWSWTRHTGICTSVSSYLLAISGRMFLQDSRGGQRCPPTTYPGNTCTLTSSERKAQTEMCQGLALTWRALRAPRVHTSDTLRLTLPSVSTITPRALGRQITSVCASVCVRKPWQKPSKHHQILSGHPFGGRGYCTIWIHFLLWFFKYSTVNMHLSHFCSEKVQVHNLLKDFIYWFERGRAQRESQTPQWTESPMQGSIQGPQNHDPSQRQKLNRVTQAPQFQASVWP